MVYLSGWEGGGHVGVMELTHGHEFFLLSLLLMVSSR